MYVKNNILLLLLKVVQHPWLLVVEAPESGMPISNIYLHINNTYYF